MIAKIQLKLNNDVLLTVIKMVKHTDDYIVENVTDALLISIKEDLINKLEDKAKNIQKQVSILDHNRKHSLVLKYHEAYSLYKLLDAVYAKELFSEDLHIKKIKRLITELNNKLDIFAKEEDITIVDEELLQDDMLTEEQTENKPGKILVLEEVENTPTKTDQIEMPILFDFSEAFAGEQEEETVTPNTTEEASPVLEQEIIELELTATPIIEENNNIEETILEEVELTTTPTIEGNNDIKEIILEEVVTEQEENITSIEHLEELSVEEPIFATTEETELQSEVTSKEVFPTQETIYDTESDLFMSSMPEALPKLDWERITTEDRIESEETTSTKEKVAFSNPKYNELFNIAKTGINVDADDLVVKPENEESLKEEEPAHYGKTEVEISQAKDVMQIEIFDVETVEAEQTETKPKKEKKKEKKTSTTEQIGQISLF
ncbi:MAG: hypothetical protein LBI73_13445 [Myroides sp.]|jgi:hypothetical protein|nr:hypothetical protein [Myroides sp.]